MHATASSERISRPVVLAAAAGVGALVALSVVLWAKFGSAAFLEQVAAGLGLCL